MTKRRTILGFMAGAAMGALSAFSVQAQEVTLKLHHFLPAQANVPKLVLDVWADNVERDSGGRIKVERYAAMALGGAPPELIDQAIDGVADVIWTVNGYTPGRFPRVEAFELPFMVSDARAASSALWQMYEEHMKDTDYADVQILGTWVHGPGMFHTARPVAKPDDLKGMKIRGGSRGVNDLLALTGAEAVGMPISQVPESLSKGVIEGSTMPWEVTPALKISELVSNHTEIEGPALYVLSFVLAMNKEKYDSLPDDLKAVIDKNSGHDFSVFAGGTQSDADAMGRQIAVDRGNNIITVSGADAQVWVDLVQPLYAKWVENMKAQGMDGQALIDQAKSLMAAYK